MAIQTYIASQGQSIYDICLNTYGSLDFLYKIVQDNNFGSINNNPTSGQAFTYDTSYIVDQIISAGFKQTKLATLQNPNLVASNDNNQSLNLIAQKYTTSQSGGSGGSQPTPVKIMNMYQSTQADAYTSNADGVTTVTFASWIGWSVLSVTKEIQPLKASQFTWNSSSGQLNLVGVTLANGETVYVLFQKFINP